MTASVRIDSHGANEWVGDGTQQLHLTLLPGVERELAAVITDCITGAF